MTPSEPIHDTIHVVKVIVDTVRAPSKDSLELLNKLDGFYNNSWSRLLIFVTLSFAIVGIVIPVLIQWYQKKELKLSEDRLKAEIKSEMEAVISSIENSFSETINKAKIEINNNAQKEYEIIYDKIQAAGHHVQAIIFADKAPMMTVSEAILATVLHLKVKDYYNATNSLTIVHDYIRLCTKSSIEERLTKVNTSFSREMEDIVKYDYKRSLRSQIEEIQMFFNGLTD